MYEHLPKKIVYLRHPQCLHNIAYQEAMDQGIPNKQSPLTPLGEQQRDITAAYLKKEFGGFDAVFSSTFIRTHTIPAAAGWLPQMYSLLDERSNGVWHHMPRSAVLEKYPDEEIRSKTLGYYQYRAPEGESCPDVELRDRKSVV